jgi:hypothetical protein
VFSRLPHQHPNDFIRTNEIPSHVKPNLLQQLASQSSDQPMKSHHGSIIDPIKINRPVISLSYSFSESNISDLPHPQNILLQPETRFESRCISKSKLSHGVSSTKAAKKSEALLEFVDHVQSQPILNAFDLSRFS